MANTAISALPTVTTPLAGTEVLPIVQSSSTKRVTIAQIASYIGSSSYTLPTASVSVLGGIKIGTGLSIDGSGVVSASGVSIPVILDDVSGLADAYTSVFTLKIAGTQVSTTYIVDSKDLQVTVDGRRLQPYTDTQNFVFMPSYDAYKGFRVRENRLIIYNAPEVGSQISVIAQPTSTTKQIRRYPFSATNIGLGD
jgi:hypothetical protein